MCRRNQLLGMGILGFGLGLLAACFFESGFFCGCMGVAAICFGLVMLKKK